MATLDPLAAAAYLDLAPDPQEPHMTAASKTGYDYWYLRLPKGKREKRSEEQAITDELSELAGRGWEPVSMMMPSVLATFVLLRKPAA